MVGSVKLQNT